MLGIKSQISVKNIAKQEDKNYFSFQNKDSDYF